MKFLVAANGVFASAKILLAAHYQRARLQSSKFGLAHVKHAIYIILQFTTLWPNSHQFFTMKKKILLSLLAILVIIQFIKPARNQSNDETYGVGTKYPMPEDVKSILKAACNDCHSNSTEYPWYADVQPTAWWLAGHVKGGKKHLNYSEFTKLPIAVQHHKFEETIEMVKEKKMPISSYTWFGLHPEAKLTEEQRTVLTQWAQANMDSLKAQYPADSLVLRR